MVFSLDSGGCAGEGDGSANGLGFFDHRFDRYAQIKAPAMKHGIGICVHL
jgi:hypothetical protein